MLHDISWIHAVHRENRRLSEAREGGVIEAFYAGYTALKGREWNHIVKLDGDLSFGADLFQKIFNYFQQSQDLGVGGGSIYNLVSGAQVMEKHPLFHVRGATKIYKRENAGMLLEACCNRPGVGYSR